MHEWRRVMAHRPRRDTDFFDVPPIFKIWFILCGIVGLGLVGLAVWAVVKLVNHVTG